LNPPFRIILFPLQAHQFKEALDESRDRTGVEGLLCTVSRHFDSASGGTVLELQAAKLSQVATRKIQQILRSEFSNTEQAVKASLSRSSASGSSSANAESKP
jgi:hypothetical protein